MQTGGVWTVLGMQTGGVWTVLGMQRVSGLC